jgi:hypothetical protein
LRLCSRICAISTDRMLRVPGPRRNGVRLPLRPISRDSPQFRKWRPSPKANLSPRIFTQSSLVLKTKPQARMRSIAWSSMSSRAHMAMMRPSGSASFRTGHFIISAVGMQA